MGVEKSANGEAHHILGNTVLLLQKDMIGIYSIRNKVNGKLYIGQSIDIKRRWMEHRTPKNIQKDEPLKNDIRRYGINSFEFSVICECDIDKLDELEKYYIKELKPEYNKVLGGKGNCGMLVSEKTRQILREYGNKQWTEKTNEQKEFIIRNNLTHRFLIGHITSNETIEKIRKSLTGKKKTTETIKKLSDSQKKSMIGNKNGNKETFIFDTLTFDISYYRSIKECAEQNCFSYTQIIRAEKEKRLYRKRYFIFCNRSVETIGDECNQVGEKMSYSSKCAAMKMEEIVHSDKMVNCQESDKGIVQLAIRSGQFKTINVRDVRDGEIIGEDFLSGELQFRMLRENREQAKVIGYVGFFELTNGFRKMAYWTVAELEQHAGKYSQTYSADKRYGKKSSKWSSDFDAMAKKTVLKNLLSKYAPLSVEMQNAIKYDQATVINENGDARYVDNQEQAMSGDERLDEIARKEAEMEAQKAYEEAEVVEENDDEAKDNLFD